MARRPPEDDPDLDAADLDDVMSAAIAREAHDVTIHQLREEREAKARFSRPDVFLASLLAGFGVGLGWAAGRRKR